MKNDTAAVAPGRQRSAAATGYSNNGNGSNSSNNNAGSLASASTGNLGSQTGQRSKAGGVRAGSAKYYDIASTILGKSGDVETVFLNAAKTGNVTKLEQILSQRDHANLAIDCRDKKTGNTALIWAAKRGHSKAVELLLSHGADATLCNYEAQTAIELGFSPVKTVLLDWVEINQQTTATLLLQAAWQGNLAMVCKVLSSGGSKFINCQNEEGLTPLMLVSRDILLFERLAAQLNRHYSPVEVAEELMKAGATIHVTDNDGRSSLHYASQSRAGMAERLVNALIGGGLDPELRDKRLFTPIHLASQLGNTQNVVALIDGGSEVNVRGFGGLTPLHMTAYNDHQKTAVTLLNHGADVCIVDDRGFTALDLAKTRRMKTTLKDAWMDATRTDKDSGVDTDINSNVNAGIKENKSVGKDEDPRKKKSAPAKKRPEVIFDNSKTISNAQAVLAANKNKLSNVERCKQREKKILEDVEALKAAHPVLQRETTRMLGTSRNMILPQIGRSSSPERSQQVCLTPNYDGNSPVPFNRGDESRWSLEETRLQLLSRGRSVSDIKLGIGRQSRLTSLPSQESDILILEDAKSSFRSSPLFDRRSFHHQRARSDPVTAKMGDIAASCEQFLPNTRGKRSTKAMPGQANGRDTPSSPAFITQHNFNFMNKEQEKTSPRLEDKVGQSLELLRCRSLLKEDFILEESRPKENSSGSDPASSSSSLSSSSPRDQSSLAPHSPSKTLKHDPSLSTLLEHSERHNIDQRKISDLSYEFEVKPLIRDPQRRIRRNSENSASVEICSSSSEFTAGIPKERGIVRTNSHRNVPNLFNGSTLSPRIISSVHKSQSLESLSPKSSSQSPRNESMHNVSKTKDTNSDSYENERKLSLPNKTSLQKAKSISMPVSRKIASDPDVNNSMQRLEEKPSNVRRQIAPFSGKARVINNDDLDTWDSSNQQGENSREETTDLNSFFTPVKSAQEPWKSLSSQNVCEGEIQNAQVTKSCADEVKTKSPPVTRPQTSANESGSAKQSVVNKSISRDTKEKPKQSVSFKNQNAALKSHDTSVRKSAQSSTLTKSISNPTPWSKPVSSSQEIGDILAAKLQASRAKTLSQSINNAALSSKSFEDFEEMSEDEEEPNMADLEMSLPVSNMFVISEESIRQGSASKVRLQERLASAKRQKNEAQESKSKKIEENTEVATKDKPITKVVAKIEQSLRKNETQIALQRKSMNNKEEKAQSSNILSQSNSEKGNNTKNSSLLNKSKNVSVTSSLPSNQTGMKKDGKSVSSPSAVCNMKSSSPSQPATKTNGDNKTGAFKQKTTTSTSVTISNKSTPSVSVPAKSTCASNKSEKSPSESKQAKALDPNVILTPRSTEPLVKIKLQSNSYSALKDSPLLVAKPNTDITSTPLIVNPFEGFAQNTSHPLQQTTKDAIVKLKKTPKSISVSSKTSKKTPTTTKRPLSGSSRQSSATGNKKRTGKGKELKTENLKDSRPKSSKKNGRLTKKKEAQEPTDLDLIEEVEKPDTALISGIGWQLSTSCIDTSNLNPSKEISYAESSDSAQILYREIFNDEEAHDHITREFEALSHKLLDTVENESMKMNPLSATEKQALEVFKEKITLNSPRFLEMKQRQESQSNIQLPVLTNDGFPPMNLDMTQENSSEMNNRRQMEYSRLLDRSNPEPSNEDLRGLADDNEAIQREIFLNKLTPIPEASFVSRTVSAISKFDKSVKDERLSQLLEDTPRDEKIKTPRKSNKHSSHLLKSQNDSFNNEYTYTSMGKAIKRTQSLKEKTQRKPIRERTFSETKSIDPNKVEEDETIQEAIEEILSSTISSTTSTLKGYNLKSNVSASNTLTEVDRNVLRKLTATKDSPFHASSAVATERSIYSPRPPSPQDETEEQNQTNNRLNNMGKSANVNNVNLAKQIVSPVQSNMDMKASIGGKPPLSNRSSLTLHNTPKSNAALARSTSMKAAGSLGHISDDIDIRALEMSEEESKQLARVMSSLRRMELHAGWQNSSTHRDGFGGSAKVIKTSKADSANSQSICVPASAFVRPSSTGAAAKFKGRFHELKEANQGASGRKVSGNQAIVSQDVKSSLPQGTKLTNQASGEQQSTTANDKLMESLNGDMDHVTDAAEIQNLYIRLTERRDSLCGSEFSIDSVKSVDDTIQWKKGNVLGKGAFGTVWCGLTSEGELIAVKQIELTTMDQAKAHHEYEKIQEEVELLKTLNHINIVGYLGTSLEDNIVSIFMQFIPGGSLASILARFGALEESVFQRYTKQILEGVEYLHDNDVIHRDLKGANVMLMPTGVIKLIDFGCAKRLCINLNLSQTEILKSMKGTPFWMAPEVVNETGHGKKSDIWSIGCTVFEMATRKPPWAEMNPLAAIFAIGRADKPVPRLDEKFSQDAVEFVRACMTRDQDQRPSATGLLNHVFITRRNTRKVSKNKEENVSVC